MRLYKLKLWVVRKVRCAWRGHVYTTPKGVPLYFCYHCGETNPGVDIPGVNMSPLDPDRRRS